MNGAETETQYACVRRRASAPTDIGEYDGDGAEDFVHDGLDKFTSFASVGQVWVVAQYQRKPGEDQTRNQRVADHGDQRAFESDVFGLVERFPNREPSFHGDEDDGVAAQRRKQQVEVPVKVTAREILAVVSRVALATDTYHQNADLSDRSAPKYSGRMMLNKEVINKRISLSARTMVKIETQNLIISRREKTKIDSRLPMMPTATAQGMTACVQR